MTITYGTRFSSMPNWSSSTDSFSRVQFNNAFDQVDAKVAGWSESNITATDVSISDISGFFHYDYDETGGGNLSVYSALDTAWILIRDGYEIRASMIDAKGDLIGGTAAKTVGKLTVGTNNQALVADSSAGTGLVWANIVNSLTGTANEVEIDASTGSITIGLPSAVTIGTLTIDSVAISTVQTGLESFVDNDTSVMTSAAVQDKILAYSYATVADTIPIATIDAKGDLLVGSADDTVVNVGVGADDRVLSADASAASGMVWNTTVSSLTGTAAEITLSGSTGAITIGLPDDVTITGTLTVTTALSLDSVSISTVQSSGEAFADNDTSIMTSASIQDKILVYGYETVTNAVQKGTLVSKGDIYARSSTAPVRLAVGTNNQGLVADSTASTGVKWADIVNGLTGTASEVTVSASTGSVTIGLPSNVTIAGTLTVDSVGIAAVQTSAESFVDNNTSIMTSGAVADKIEAYGYVTSAAAISSVVGTSLEVEAFTSSGAVTIGLPDDVTIAGTLTLNSVGIAAVQTGSGSFSDNDTSIMTSAAVQDKIVAYSYATVVQLNAFQTTIDSVETMFHMEVMV